jgi:hypothetical protein
LPGRGPKEVEEKKKERNYESNDFRIIDGGSDADPAD